MFGPGAADISAIGAMTGALTHRGPDDDGLWSDPESGIALGNRRLAIIDISPAGHQPMRSADGRFVITFNGEIYNHPEIRARLEAEGSAPQAGWRGHSDTETFLQAIAVWGLGPALERAVGMFAFALWDRTERSLRLVRDRFGEKPLYYGWAGKTLLFGSELKALRAYPGFGTAIDRRALGLFMARGYVPAPHSIYRGTFKLPPASVLTVESGAAPLEEPPAPEFFANGVGLKSYWSYRSLIEVGLSDPITDPDEALDALEIVLAKAIGGQSLADVPVGAFLSGGIDSSTIVALYQKYSSVPVKTFTIGFADKRYDEAADARAVARHFGTEHHEQQITAADALSVIPKLPLIYDEPFADASQIPTYLVSAFARRQVTVALSGDGGDELFGGYNRYTALPPLAAAMRWSRPVGRPLAGLLGLLPAQAYSGAAALVKRRRQLPEFGAKIQRIVRLMGKNRELGTLMGAFLDDWAPQGSPVRDVSGSELAQLAKLDLQIGGKADGALRMMHADALAYLPDDVLCKVDRASMAVSLETHAPFLDHRVAELAARIPMAMKIRHGRGKDILRRLLAREAPPALFDRPKAGFAVPVGEWLRGPLRDWAEDLLDPKAMSEAGLLDAARVRRRWEAHLSGREGHASALWSVLMFEAWRRANR